MLSLQEQQVHYTYSKIYLLTKEETMKYVRSIILITICILAAIALMAVKCSFVVDDIVLPSDITSDQRAITPGTKITGDWKLVPDTIRRGGNGIRKSK